MKNSFYRKRPHDHFEKGVEIKHKPLKRTFDITFSIFALLFGLPCFLLIAMCVKLSSRGPIFYSHERIGRGGKPFFCYKFRSMYKDSDERLKDLLNLHPELRKEWEKTHKLKNDPRITPIGLFLRKSSLDELPQFWNVLRGDLSVVGPRPVIKQEIEKYFGEKASVILSVRPGLTGIWQVSGRNNTAYSHRIQLDELYVNRQSLLLDLKLIAKTIPAMIFSKGAY
ncbi:MAG: sugar transferase [Parachlamydiaceae bacterium]|nr:sugar transferase [Parachlamydiaceae bacterium]